MIFVYSNRMHAAWEAWLWACTCNIMLLQNVLLWWRRGGLPHAASPLLTYSTYHSGDGFGIGWYNPDGTTPRADRTPCTFTSITPAWCAAEPECLFLPLCISVTSTAT